MAEPETKIESPYFPIIFIRGYAMTGSEVEDTVADPYMGLNLGATKIRQLWTGSVERYYFESPLVRLMKDFGYLDVYHGGAMMAHDNPVKPRSVVVYRYYDSASKELGVGKLENVEGYAKGLNDLILTVRDRVCGEDADARKAFRVYLVAHSMGGLICRCFLQNQTVGTDEAKKLVDKVYTYATPHNGIDLEWVGNVPGFLSYHKSDTFNRDRMQEYLSLPPGAKDVASLNGKFDPDRFFCLVGTNDKDYEVAGGSVRKLVGPMSDGLVRIANATVYGPSANGDRGNLQAPRAFVHRSHSGHYGIVNSEEGYQNLTRFFFGDVRVDGVLEISELTLPPKIQILLDDGKEIRASYHFEVIVRVRGAHWDLHRRTLGENSAIFRSFDDLFRPKQESDARYPALFSVFLNADARINTARPSLGFSVDLGVQVPQYEVDRKLWFDDHFEGGYLFRDKINLEAIPPAGEKTSWSLKYGFDSRTPNRTDSTAGAEKKDNSWIFRIPIEQRTNPGIRAELVLRARSWNQ